MDENRGKYLNRRLSNNISNYTSGDLPRFPVNHKNYFSQYISQFGELDYNYPGVRELLSREDLIIDNSSIYVFFIKGLKRTGVNALKLHICNNFLVNWDIYKRYYQDCCPTEPNHITISSVSGDNIFDWYFDRFLFTPETMYSDIQFIFLNYKAKEYKKGFFDEQIKSHIETRNIKGLITIIFYIGTEAEFDSCGYDDSFSTFRDIRKFTDLSKIEPKSTSSDVESMVSIDSSSVDNALKYVCANMNTTPKDPFMEEF